MDKSKKLLISIIIDIILLGVIAYSVSSLVKGDVDAFMGKVYMLIIVICIPVGFLTTFYNVAWDKFDEKELQEDDEDNEAVEDVGTNNKKID